MRGSIALAAAVNFLLTAATWWLAKRNPSRTQPSATTSDEDATTVAGPRFQVSTPIVVAFVSGFVILASEVLWTRLFINFLSGNVLIFATVVTAVLAGLGTPIQTVLDPGATVPSFQTEFVRMRTITNSFFSARLLLFEGKNEAASALIKQRITEFKVTPEELHCLNHFYSLGGSQAAISERQRSGMRRQASR